jgi:hypothetical protein
MYLILQLFGHSFRKLNDKMAEDVKQIQSWLEQIEHEIKREEE